MLFSSAAPHFHASQLPFGWLCLGCLSDRKPERFFPCTVLAPFLQSGMQPCDHTLLCNFSACPPVTFLAFTTKVLALFRL